MTDRFARALGIDARQWRALVATYIRMDFRARGGPVRQGGRSERRMPQLAGIALVGIIAGASFAVVAAVTPDVLLSASLLTTYAAATTMMMLLVDFTGVVLAPEDYAILAPRPVGSRTYFAARLAAVGVYVGTLSLANGLIPALVYGFKAGVLAAPAALAAVLLCDLSTTVLVISGYITLLRWVHPSRLKRATTYVQLAGATMFYFVYYLASTGFRRAFLDRSFETLPWLWAVPSTWFAAIVRVAAGNASGATWTAALAALAIAAACVPLAAGRLSLDYARQIGEMSAVAEPARRRRTFRLPGFSRGEARAVALLVRAQFRFDQRFRMGILGIIPLTGFYMLLGLDEGALRDPFVGGSTGPGVYFAVIFIPMTLHSALTSSESWRAAWIFFATPASHARIVVAAKNFVTVYFLGTYVVALAAFWSWFFEKVWHAAVHALLMGALAHLLLQLAVITRPALPFAAEPHKAQRSGALLLLFIAGGVVAGLFPFLLTFVYRSPVTTIGMIVFLAAVTAAVEWALRLRVDEAIGELEFRS
jgi:hypothetical protein